VNSIHFSVAGKSQGVPQAHTVSSALSLLMVMVGVSAWNTAATAAGPCMHVLTASLCPATRR
jgi:hypothetical protein